VFFANFVVIFLFHLLRDKQDDGLPVCKITLTRCVIFFIKSWLRCVSLIGNPVEIGSGPAAVTPAFHCKSVKDPFSLELPLFRLIDMGRLLKGRGSQKTCLGVLLLVCGQRNRRQQPKG
jgi:hypothetical protein